VVDGDVDERLSHELNAFDQVEEIQLLGNSRAFRFALDLATSRDFGVTYFAEDDYLWSGRSIVDTLAILRGFPEIDYASPYAHPFLQDPTLTEVRRHRSRSFSANGSGWTTTPRTTMTFAVRTDALRRDAHYWQLASYGRSPKDGYSFEAIIDGRWFRLIGNAAFRDPRRVLNARTVRLLTSCLSTRVGVGRRPLLVQPMDGLATHVHEPYLCGGEDWPALSLSYAVPSPD